MSAPDGRRVVVAPRAANVCSATPEACRPMTSPAKSSGVTYGWSLPSSLRIGPGSTPTPTTSSSSTPVEHLLGDPGLEHGGLQVMAVDEHRCDERLEALDADSVERSGADPRQVDLALCDVGERAGLVVDLAGPPAVVKLDLQGADRQPFDIVGPAHQLLRGFAVVRLGERQHQGSSSGLAAGSAGVHLAAPGKQHAAGNQPRSHLDG